MPEAPSHVRIRQIDPELPLPTRAHPDDAGLDLCARTSVTLAPGERAVIPTGIAVAIPRDHVGLLCARSGLAVRAGLGLVNGTGVIDAGYRGEVAVVLVNHDLTTPAFVQRGDRIAQLIVVPITRPIPLRVDHLDDTERGMGGFGSTGTVGA